MVRLSQIDGKYEVFYQNAYKGFDTAEAAWEFVKTKFTPYDHIENYRARII